MNGTSFIPIGVNISAHVCDVIGDLGMRGWYVIAIYYYDKRIAICSGEGVNTVQGLMIEFKN